MKKLLLSALVIFVFAGYSLRSKFGGHDDVNVVKPPSLSLDTPQTSSSDSTTPAPASSSPPAKSTPATTTQTPPPATPVTPKGMYKDGSYTGPVTDAFYGNVQVKAIVKNGKITNVVFLQYPNDRSQSIQINSQATPWLSQEAVQAQSANVDIISGATDTSMAFIQSLTAALTQAKT